MLKLKTENANRRKNFKIILADINIETFEKLENLFKKYDFVNLSSESSVNFIMQSENIDLIIISKKISGITKIKETAARKKIPVYVIEDDLRLRMSEKEINNLIKEEICRKETRESRKYKFFLPFKINRKPENKKVLINDFYQNDTENSSSQNEKGEIKLKRLKNKSVPGEEIHCIEKEYLRSESQGINNIDTNKSKYIKTFKQSIVIFIKAKGGVGSTAMALCLCAAFKEIKTLLIDLNFSEGGGDLSYYLDLPKSPNILNFTNEYNINSLKNSTIKIADNVDVIQTPPTFEMSRKIELQDIYCLSDIARKRYHLLIFDMAGELNDIWFGVVDMADLIVMISDFSPGSIGRLANINNRFFYNDLNRILVINKFINAEPAKNIKENFIGLNDILFIKECKALNNKFDFLDLNLNKLEEIKVFFNKVFSFLTCD